MLKQRLIRYIIGLGLTFFFILNASDKFKLPLIQSLENQAYDLRLGTTLPQNVNRKVVIIDIDEKSLGEIGHWPWRRNVMADIVDNLFDYYHVKVIGFDIVFPEKDEGPTDDILEQMENSQLAKNPEFMNFYRQITPSLFRDKRFGQALANRSTVMGVVFDTLDTSVRKGLLPTPLLQFDQSTIDNFQFYEPAGYIANLATLQKPAHTGGFFDNPALHNDGVFRRVPLLQAFEHHLYPSLALAVVSTALDDSKIQLGYSVLDEATGQKSLEWVYVGDIAIPVDERSNVLVPYIGPTHSFEYISASDILYKRVPKEKLQNMITLFGTSAAGMLDLRTTPLEKAYPGVEVHANIIQGILDQTIKHKPEYIIGFEIILVILLGTGLTFILPMLSPVWGSMASLAMVALIIIGNYAAWISLGIVLPLASPLLLIGLLFILNMTLGFFVESRGKRQLTHLFGQYVPPELVDEMSKNLAEINLDGEIRNMSVLFTDVRGFTTISENMEPKQLTLYINAFLTPLTEVIHHNRGTIDKYMGDAIMAFWGAPLRDEDHALHALTTAVQMIERIQLVNQEFEARGWPSIRIGVGVNSGDMNVGNKGSEFRVDYTVLGDAVNLGSRLEGLTKTYGVDIITSEATRHLVPEFEYRELDLVRVKGKDKPVRIFEPLGLVETVEKPVRNNIKKFHHALKTYREQNWDTAEQDIFQLHQADPDKVIYKIYLDRIAYYRQNPPGENWDGVFTHTSK